MAAGGVNEVVHVAPTNRAPVYTDAALDGNLLAAAAFKTINLADAEGNPIFAAAVLIINSSGQDASVAISTARGIAGKNAAGASRPFLDNPVNPIHVVAGESIGPIPVRVASIKETNLGAGAQAGLGVRYVFTMEPAK